MKYALIAIGCLNIAAIVMCAFLMLRDKEPVQVPVQTIVNTIYDSTKVISKPIYLREIKEKILRDTIRLKIPADVDTSAILREFFTSRYYLHEFRDSNITINIKDSVRYNAIVFRQVDYRWLRPFSSSTTNIIEPVAKWNWLIGFGYEWRTPYPSIMPTFGAQYKSWSLMAGYNLIYKSPSIHFNYKLNGSKDKPKN
jgi:hypothetical protein